MKSVPKTPTRFHMFGPSRLWLSENFNIMDEEENIPVDEVEVVEIDENDGIYILLNWKDLHLILNFNLTEEIRSTVDLVVNALVFIVTCIPI